MVQPVFPKLGLGNNYSMLDVYDVVPLVKKANKNNQLPTTEWIKLCFLFKHSISSE